MKKNLLRLLVALGGLALLTGCLKIDGDIRINTDDTISGEVLVAFSTAWAISQGEDPEGLVDTIEDELTAAPDSGVTGERYDDGEFSGMQLTLTEVPIDRVRSATSDVLRIERVGGNYEVTGDFSELDPTIGGELPSEVPWSVHLSVTFPNGVTEHDGTLSGDTVTWELGPGNTSMHAVGPGPQTPFLQRGGFLVLAIIVIVVAAGLLLWRWSRRRHRADEAAGREPGFRARRAAAREPASTDVENMFGGSEESRTEPGAAKPDDRT
ncbi:hypothetical protein EXU48_02555 [Occultella glacieicola]|uniref:LppM domain-containing protein n=1 Tax=Occultella glacieicola TaxID=2518684 RepID=A0ABY2E9A0_9MICO|nr:hypothetical protein [Occultella glacieicola]TDE99080.1 hypothetical protein EXU48_02555 [Occultella glacieicola]